MSGASDHWFDRLAAPQTRRQTLRAALAGAALAVPFLRSAEARAQAGGSCRKGCFWFAHQETRRATTSCENALQATVGSVDVTLLLLPPLAMFTLPNVVTAFLAYDRCKDHALLAQKAALFDCLAPGCSGFDPNRKNGPCDPCKAAGGICCPDEGSVNGFVCCSYCSCSGKGCAATPCGG